jgi:hypothetical protein
MFSRGLMQAVRSSSSLAVRGSARLTRGFASKPQRVAPTMLGHEGRLAQGLFAVAKEDKKVDKVYADVVNFEGVLNQNAEIQAELANSSHSLQLRYVRCEMCTGFDCV